jgi:hypothetical protein
MVIHIACVRLISDMSTKSLIWIGVFVGGTAGAYLPALWGNTNALSLSSIALSMIGGLAGIWLGWKLGGN